ncbi:MAG: COX15/CtaA family protein [Nitriliruptoraceae bacterium]
MTFVRRLAVATSIGTLVLIAMGGGVRATDSGLACPDWPACYGMWIPPADFNMWMEHSHRLWAGVIGIAVALLMALTFVDRKAAPAPWRLSALAGLLVIVQAGLGAVVVLLHLRAGLVTSHLGMSLVIVGALIAVAVRAGTTTPDAGAQFVGTAWNARTVRFGSIAAAAVFVQALLGGQATGRGAAYVFNAVPIWLATDAWSGHIREILHVTHRAGGYLVAAAVVAFAVHAARRSRRLAEVADASANRAISPASSDSMSLKRAARIARNTRFWAIIAAGLVVVQVGLGLANVLTQAMVPVAVGHLSVASWLWAVLVLIVVRERHARDLEYAWGGIELGPNIAVHGGSGRAPVLASSSASEPSTSEVTV